MYSRRCNKTNKTLLPEIKNIFTSEAVMQILVVNISEHG
jgi:hypothetical protein